MPDSSTSATQVKSASRFADILEFVADSTEPPTFPEIAAGLVLPKSSLHHLLATLTARGYLEQVAERGGYRLGPSIERLATRMRRPPSYAGRVQPALRELARAINETCAYYELHGDEADVMKVEAAQQQLAYSMRVGERAPLYCVSAGKVLLAHMDAAWTRAYLARTPLRAFTAHTLTSRRAIERELQAVRAGGFGYSREEYALGIVGVATAVHARGKVVGAIGVAMPTVRLHAESDARIRRALAEAASAVERSL